MAPNKQEQLNQQNIQSFESVLADTKNKLNKIYKKENMMELHDKIAEFGYKLMDKYPDCQNRILFHVLIGSTPPPNAVVQEDFPDEDSIVKFIENL